MNLENGVRFEAKLRKTEPRDDRLSFRGRVLALVDRFSFSNAAVVAAIIQDYNFGFLIGEETSYVPSSCAAIHTFKLPHTQMGVVFPKACSIRPNGDPSMRGVIPDLEVSDDVFTEKDEVLDRALELIRKDRVIAVGTPVSRRPPHRSVRTVFLYTAPTSGA
jgi:C-terminal processing protease CtpA/Prc